MLFVHDYLNVELKEKAFVSNYLLSFKPCTVSESFHFPLLLVISNALFAAIVTLPLSSAFLTL